MSKRKRRRFTADQKADAIRLVREVGSVAQVARDLDLTETSLRNWVKQADIDEGRGPEGALTTEEKEEIRRLRRENRTLRMERDFLKKAAVFFAKDTRIGVRADRGGEDQLPHRSDVSGLGRFPWRVVLLASSAARDGWSTSKPCAAKTDQSRARRESGDLWKPSCPSTASKRWHHCG